VLTCSGFSVKVGRLRVLPHCKNLWKVDFARAERAQNQLSNPTVHKAIKYRQKPLMLLTVFYCFEFSMNTPLAEKIAQKIATRDPQRITFAEFMADALYDPDFGYYASQAAQLGPWGDFVTSPHLCADFGELMAVQLVDFWRALDCPSPFTVVEMGAGQGLIAADILRFMGQQRSQSAEMAQFWSALEYRIVEKASALIQAQRSHLASFLAQGISIDWVTLAQLSQTPITGCLFSNELVDAFPVHRVEVHPGKVLECYVSLAEEPKGVRFVDWVDAPSTSALSTYLSQQGGDLLAQVGEAPYKTEINLDAIAWMQSVTQALARGYVLTIDYGYRAHQYYHPRRREGTLRCFSRHRSHSDPYWAVGQQDITAHVNFSALETAGDEGGLRTLGYTQQGLFLMALGLGDRLLVNNADSTAMTYGRSETIALEDRLQRREALHALMNPMGLGGFQVLIQAKALTPEQLQYPLRGLQMSVNQNLGPEPFL
jgi:SAM-dependent MidA family methyltransferase